MVEIGVVVGGHGSAGMIPMPEWTDASAFADPSTTIQLLPQNADICGEPLAVNSFLQLIIWVCSC
jgi:hypothetical protein